MLLMLDEVFYSMAGPECTQPQWAYNGTIDEDRPQWEGCPLAVCTPQTLPAAVRNRGVCFRLVGPRQALVPFALRNRITHGGVGSPLTPPPPLLGLGLPLPGGRGSR